VSGVKKKAGDSSKFCMVFKFFSAKELTSICQVAIFAASKCQRSPVAQLVEQVAVNHLVAGSSPAWGASLYKGLFSSERRPFFLCRLNQKNDKKNHPNTNVLNLRGIGGQALYKR
jgi:hypothetical protein